MSLLASFYHLVFQYPDREQILKLLSEHGGPLIDLGCATGRVMEIAAAHGYTAIGVDHSPEMIEQGKARLNNYPNVSFVKQDFCTPIVTHREQVGVVTCIANTYSMLLDAEQRMSCLNAVRSMLKPDGRFFCYIKSDFPEGPQERSMSVQTDTGLLFFKLRFTEDFDSLLRTYYLTFSIGGKSENHVFQTRILKFDRFISEFNKSGLEIELSAGDFTGSKINNESKLWFVIARRSKR